MLSSLPGVPDELNDRMTSLSGEEDAVDSLPGHPDQIIDRITSLPDLPDEEEAAAADSLSGLPGDLTPVLPDLPDEDGAGGQGAVGTSDVVYMCSPRHSSHGVLVLATSSTA